MFRLLQSLFRAQEMRAVANEIEHFENTCGSALPEGRSLQLRALVSLSDFEPAVGVADALIAENRASPKAWAARADVYEKTGKLKEASRDLRQALALFPDGQ
jgi:Flp pilus assembly protein TadD